MESRKYEAVNCERFDAARKLKEAIGDLETAGLQLGAMEMEKKVFVSKSDYEGAKSKRAEMDVLREETYRRLSVKELLETPSPSTRRKALDHDHENLPPVGVSKKRRTPSGGSLEEDEVKPKSLLRPSNL